MRRLMSARWRHEHRRAIRLMATASLAVALVGGLATAAVAAGVSGNPFGNEQVGTSYANGILLPTNQWIKPIGSRLLVGKGRVLSSSISPNGQYLAALTWNDFTGFLTIINLKTGQIIQQLGTGASGDPVIGDGTVAADGPLWSADGKSLWFPQTSTDFYPVGAQYDPAIGKIVVTNDKGIGARGPGKTVNEGPGTAPGAGSVTGHNTYSDTGSLTEFTMPSTAALGAYTHQVFVDNGWEHLLASRTLTNCSAAAAAVPARLGCPSTIKHVFLIVRENRTYDQVFGDAGKGNDDPTLAQFGATITPNAHKLASSYGLFDNFYDEGTLSADGHNWLVQADANDYIEREFGAFYRSYPAQGGDALAYQRDGFLWNAAEAAGRTVKAFGEYNNFITQPDPVPSWSDYYQDSQILEGKATGPLPVPISATNTYADIPSLNAIDDHAYPAFNLGIPDQYRTDIWLQSFNQSVKTGQLANLNLIWMPDDHTAGVGSGDPNPVAEVADNDLAVGRIIDTISHSKFWKNSAVFVVEDDTQNGVDHVDGHRGPLLAASPYARRGIIDSSYYSQLNVVKTIEQILGVAPMNQEDRAAVPMSSAFTSTPDFAPYNVVPNQIPLTQGLAPASSSASAAPSFTPASPATLGIPAAARAVYEQWVVWSRNGRFNGPGAIQDWANPAQLNRLDWYSAHDWKVPYPGDKTILAPDQVPGHSLPADYLGD